MYHIFLIHSPVEKHLGCFQILTMANNAAMNIVESCGIPLCMLRIPLVNKETKALCEVDTLFRTELEVSKEDGAVRSKRHGTCPFRKALVRKVLGVL